MEKKIIIGKFREDEKGWCLRGVRVWKTIRNKWESIKSRSDFSVRNWRRLNLWKYLMCEDLILEEAFLSLFSFASNNDGWLAEAWELVGEGGG